MANSAWESVSVEQFSREDIAVRREYWKQFGEEERKKQERLEQKREQERLEQKHQQEEREESLEAERRKIVPRDDELSWQNRERLLSILESLVGPYNNYYKNFKRQDVIAKADHVNIKSLYEECHISPINELDVLFM